MSSNNQIHIENDDFDLYPSREHFRVLFGSNITSDLMTEFDSLENNVNDNSLLIRSFFIHNDSELDDVIWSLDRNGSQVDLAIFVKGKLNEMTGEMLPDASLARFYERLLYTCCKTDAVIFYYDHENCLFSRDTNYMMSLIARRIIYEKYISIRALDNLIYYLDFNNPSVCLGSAQLLSLARRLERFKMKSTYQHNALSIYQALHKKHHLTIEELSTKWYDMRKYHQFSIFLRKYKEELLIHNNEVIMCERLIDEYLLGKMSNYQDNLKELFDNDNLYEYLSISMEKNKRIKKIFYQLLNDIWSQFREQSVSVDSHHYNRNIINVFKAFLVSDQEFYKSILSQRFIIILSMFDHLRSSNSDNWEDILNLLIILTEFEDEKFGKFVKIFNLVMYSISLFNLYPYTLFRRTLDIINEISESLVNYTLPGIRNWRQRIRAKQDKLPILIYNLKRYSLE